MPQNTQKKYVPVKIKKGQLNSPIYSRNLELSANSPDLTFETVRLSDPILNFTYRFVAPEYNSTDTLNYEQANQLVYTKELHQHDYFELLYVMQGNLYQRIESERHFYPEGSLCLLNRSIRHQEEFNTDFHCAFLRLPVSFIEIFLNEMDSFLFSIEKKQTEQITKRFFHQNIENSFYLKKEYIDFIPVSDDLEVKSYMRTLFDSLTDLLISPEIGSSYQLKCILLKIFHEFTDKNHYNTVPLNIGTDAEAELFSSINEIMKKNHGRISRAQLQKELSYNPDYLNRITKKYTGMSLRQYGISLNIKEAEHLLRTTDLTIMEICEQLQFSNYTFFYKTFENIYGSTPKKYRQSLKKK